MLTDATRSRLSFTGEFLIAAAFLLATAVVALFIARELRGPRSVLTPGPAVAAEAIPVNSVSVPALMLGEAREIRVGDAVEPALAQLGAGATLVRQTSSQGVLGRRELRAYELSGTKFMLVLEPFERGGEPRVAAIYLQ